jgi:hypothetical protein
MSGVLVAAPTLPRLCQYNERRNTMRKLRKPSPAMVIALAALFVALSGSAVAAGIVPLAKRALTADNAKRALTADNSKKLGTQSTDAIVQKAVSQASQAPGPASTAAGLVAIKTAAWSNNPQQEQSFTVTCDAGSKAVAGGWADPTGWSQRYQSYPTADDSGWTSDIYTFSAAPGAQSGTVYAVCLK